MSDNLEKSKPIKTGFGFFIPFYQVFITKNVASIH